MLIFLAEREFKERPGMFKKHDKSRELYVRAKFGKCVFNFYLESLKNPLIAVYTAVCSKGEEKRFQKHRSLLKMASVAS